MYVRDRKMWENKHAHLICYTSYCPHKRGAGGEANKGLVKVSPTRKERGIITL